MARAGWASHEGNINARLDWSAVRAIRAAAGEDDVALAARFGVSKTTIRSVRTGRTWRDESYSPRHSPRSPHRLRDTTTTPPEGHQP